MLPENRVATHPGEILKEEFLDPAGITQVAFAQHIEVPLQRVNEIIRGKSGALLRRPPGCFLRHWGQLLSSG
jgi:antitoxin HigA-1